MRTVCRFLALALLLAPAAAPAATIKSGNYELALSRTASVESVSYLIRLDVKDDGTITGEIIGTPPLPALAKVAAPQFQPVLKSVKVNGDLIRLVVTSPSGDLSFEGKVGADGKPILGSFGDTRFPVAARLTFTDKTELAATDRTRRKDVPAVYTKAQVAMSKVTALRTEIGRTRDQQERAKLIKQMEEMTAEAEAEQAKLYREVIAQHPGTHVAADAAQNLLRISARAKPSADEARRWADLVLAHAETHGPRLLKATVTQLAEQLGAEKAFAAVGVELAGRAEKLLDKTDTAETQERVLTALSKAQRTAGLTAESDATEGRIAKLQDVLDAEYRAKMPIKPEAFAGRKGNSDRVVVFELFTGAQCPPCVAADLAFDGLEKTYKPADVVLIQYHLHIPGPDPMTNPNTEARWTYYREKFKEEIRGVPSSLFSGTPKFGGGGGFAAAGNKYKQYREIIEEQLETPAKASVAVSARRSGNTVTMEADVTKLDGAEDARLRFVLCEEEIRYVGGNNIRFHHMVVRDMPGGAEGFKLGESGGKHTASVDLDALKKDLTKYLDDFEAKGRKFAKPQRPLAFKNLKVIALVQDDKTGAILQAAQADLGGDRASH